MHVCVCVAESRCILLPVVLRVLQAHMQEQRDLVMCARILTSMLSLIKKEENGTAVSDVPVKVSNINLKPPVCLARVAQTQRIRKDLAGLAPSVVPKSSLQHLFKPYTETLSEECLTAYGADSNSDKSKPDKQKIQLLPAYI